MLSQDDYILREDTDLPHLVIPTLTLYHHRNVRSVASAGNSAETLGSFTKIDEAFSNHGFMRAFFFSFFPFSFVRLFFIPF